MFDSSDRSYDRSYDRLHDSTVGPTGRTDRSVRPVGPTVGSCKRRIMRRLHDSTVGPTGRTDRFSQFLPNLCLQRQGVHCYIPTELPCLSDLENPSSTSGLEATNDTVL